MSAHYVSSSKRNSPKRWEIPKPASNRYRHRWCNSRHSCNTRKSRFKKKWKQISSLKGKTKDQMQITQQNTYQISRALSQPLRASAAAIVVAAAAVALMVIFHHEDWASPNPTAAWASWARTHRLEFFGPSGPPNQYPALSESFHHPSFPNFLSPTKMKPKEK